MRTKADPARALRAVRFLIWSSWLVLGAAAVYMALPGSGDARTPPRLLFMAGAVAATLVLSTVQWQRLAEGRGGLAILLAWVVADVIALSFGVALSGGTGSPFFILYAVVPIFLATAFPRWTQGVMLLLSFGSLMLALLVTGAHIVARVLLIKMGVVAVVTAIAGVVTHELSDRERAHKQALVESERRAQLLAKLAEAARDLSQLTPAEVPAAIVDAVMSLGFESSYLAVNDPEAHSFNVVAARGGKELVGSALPTRRGIAAKVLRARSVIINAKSVTGSRPAGDQLEGEFEIGAPIRWDGELSAILVAKLDGHTMLSPEEVETFELLADQAGHALATARKFELERASVERLQELDRMKSEFIATVSHEIRTPLTAIAGIGATLHLHWNALSEEDRREFLLRLNSNAAVLDEIIAMLLDFSRLESGALGPHVEEVNLGLLVESVLNRLHGLISGHDVECALGPRCLVMADRMLLDRVIENLISNASKHTPPGTQVRVTARSSPVGIELSVEDTGPGMPEHEVARLGERFFRGGDVNSRRTRGTGLGLAFVREVLRMLGSDLVVSSRVGSGSRFAFTLPAAPGSAPHPAPDELDATGREPAVRKSAHSRTDLYR